VVHALLGPGPRARVWDHVRNRNETVLECVRNDFTFASEPVFEKRGDSVCVKRSIENHPNQFLAYFGLAQLPIDTKFAIRGLEFTLGDLHKGAQKVYRPTDESTYTLMAFAHFLPFDGSWENDQGRMFCMTDLVNAELKSGRRRPACGGTHSNFALAYLYNKHEGRNKGEGHPWGLIRDHLGQQINLARTSQLPDGSFSPSLVYGPDPSGKGVDLSASSRIYSTGHTLEWLVLALDADELRTAWVTDAVQALCTAMTEKALDPPPASPLYHAWRALRTYREKALPR
jgi:hypothetical protein